MSSGLALGFLALAGAAAAQVTLRGSQTATSLPAASSVAGPVRAGTPAIPAHDPNVEPKEMAGMLSAQNEARARLGLPALVWSGELAALADATAKTAADGACSQSAARKVGEAAGASIYWSASLRRLGGTGQPQGILPSFLVSEWSAGRRDYDLATATCRRSSACGQYARMASPTAKAVGCARQVCESQAQVWTCHYRDASSPLPAKPGLRSRIDG